MHSSGASSPHLPRRWSGAPASWRTSTCRRATGSCCCLHRWAGGWGWRQVKGGRRKSASALWSRLCCTTKVGRRQAQVQLWVRLPRPPAPSARTRGLPPTAAPSPSAGSVRQPQAAAPGAGNARARLQRAREVLWFDYYCLRIGLPCQGTARSLPAAFLAQQALGRLRLGRRAVIHRLVPQPQRSGRRGTHRAAPAGGPAEPRAGGRPAGCGARVGRRGVGASCRDTEKEVRMVACRRPPRQH